MQKITLNPIPFVEGEIQLPGSKSLTNRALLLSALAKGTTKLSNLLDSDDSRYMRNALQALGVKLHFNDDFTECEVQGAEGHFNWQSGLALYLGNAGTAMRMLTAALCLKGETKAEVVLTGEERMKARPIAHLVEALQQAGADIQYFESQGYPPLVIKNTGLKGGKVQINGSISSQYLTALLIVAPFVDSQLEIEVVGDFVSKPYIEMTIAMMKDFGVEVQWLSEKSFLVSGNQIYRSPGSYTVEGDASAASYFLAAGAIKGKVKVKGIGKNSVQGDRKFADILEKMGAKITYGDNFIQAEKGNLQGFDLDLNAIPDAAMTFAMTALFAQGETVIRNIYNWRVKETDRLYAMATELRKIGATVEEGKDYIRVQPLKLADFKEAEIETYNDHRIAMCFALIALSNTAVTILDPRCTHKTFPQFFTEFNKIVQHF